MDYDLSQLSPRDFEHLTQALAKEVLGPGTSAFGDGKDGGREATFTGPVNYPHEGQNWDGYGVVQAKYRQRDESGGSSGTWLERNIKAELDAWLKPGSQRGRWPEYVLFTSNVVLTPVPNSGGIDRVDRLIASYAQRMGLKGWAVWHFDEICRFLDIHDSVRRSYAGSITSGDVLSRLLHALPEPAPPTPPLTRMPVIGDLQPADALRFEVRPALEAGEQPGTVLPPYLLRPAFDDKLRKEVAAAAAGSRLIMVVGGSSTGKTRACWEAVRSQLPAWRIRHPLVPDRPTALLSILQEDAPNPRTVIWLNEAQSYLLAKDRSSEVASAMQSLLADNERGPTLILGTMWPDFWRQLEDRPDVNDELFADRHALHQLTDFAVTIAMPPVFTKAELTASASLVASDMRLTLAYGHTDDGRITQFLAGAPHLWRRYEQSDSAAKAILHAAMDARRCGHGHLLREEFLRRAAPGYVDDGTWHTLEDTWFDSRLATLLLPHRKLPGPLMQYRQRPDEQPLPSRVFLLADYLHERSRAHREREQPAASLWAAAADHSHTAADVVELAQAASNYAVMTCESLYLRAAAYGDDPPLKWFIQRLINAGQLQHAEHLIDEHCLDGLLLGELSAAHSLAGRLAEAERLALRAFTACKDLLGLRRLAHHLLTLGLDRTAERVYLFAAEHGDFMAAHWITERFEARGDRDEAEGIAQQALLLGSPSAVLALARARLTEGRHLDAERLCQAVIDRGYVNALVLQAREWAGRRDHLTALHFYQAAAAAEHPQALEWLCWRCEGQGDHAQAEKLARAATASGYSHALHGLAHLRLAKGQLEDAMRLNRDAAQAGSRMAQAWLARQAIPL